MHPPHPTFRSPIHLAAGLALALLLQMTGHDALAAQSVPANTEV